MKAQFLLILFALAGFTVNQNSQQPEVPWDILCGRVEDRKCILGGVLNGKLVSIDLPVCPPKAQEKQIEGTVRVQVLLNGDGEVIFAHPLSGPEELWAASIKAAVTARFSPTKLSGKPMKVAGLLLVNWKNGKNNIQNPNPTGVPGVTTISPPP